MTGNAVIMLLISNGSAMRLFARSKVFRYTASWVISGNRRYFATFATYMMYIQLVYL